MRLTEEQLAQIRTRHAHDEEDEVHESDAAAFDDAHQDRAELLAEVDALREELAQAKAEQAGLQATRDALMKVARDQEQLKIEVVGRAAQFTHDTALAAIRQEFGAASEGSTIDRLFKVYASAVAKADLEIMKRQELESILNAFGGIFKALTPMLDMAADREKSPNYVTATVHWFGRKFALTLQIEDGMTPGEKLAALTADLDEARAAEDRWEKLAHLGADLLKLRKDAHQADLDTAYTEAWRWCRVARQILEERSDRCEASECCDEIATHCRPWNRLGYGTIDVCAQHAVVSDVALDMPWAAILEEP